LLRAVDLPPQVAAKAGSADDESPVSLPALPAETVVPGRSAAAAPAPASPELVPLGKIGPLKDFVRDQEVAYISRILAQTEGNKEEAARILGVSLATLYRKLAEEPEAE
jgi:DNA-binding NtrC family response regulator